MNYPVIFKPQDFYSCNGMPFESASIHAAALAQQIFGEWLKENSKVVYYVENVPDEKMFIGSEQRENTDTHQALLVLIEPIEKNCEKHEPIIRHSDQKFKEERDFYQGPIYSCKHCSKKLKPVYEVCE